MTDPNQGNTQAINTGAGGSGGYLRDLNLQMASNPNLSGDLTNRITPITFNNVGFGSVFLVGIVVVVGIVGLVVYAVKKKS